LPSRSAISPKAGLRLAEKRCGIRLIGPRRRERAIGFPDQYRDLRARIGGTDRIGVAVHLRRGNQPGGFGEERRTRAAERACLAPRSMDVEAQRREIRRLRPDPRRR
jgi:hypothetical protein